MRNSVLQDQTDRDLAIDTSSSYIVQAPAGSGKTELLTLRYLNLLTLVNEPEEVLAITFTRKAAAEMRNRIINTLSWAQALTADELTEINEALILKRYEIACKAIAKNDSQDWKIMANPSRLRIQTIDAFCLYLSRQLPIQSSLGGSSNISNEMEECFTEAARATLQNLNQPGQLGDSICLLLAHLDNDLNKVERLLLNLLRNRDQWFSYILEMKDSLSQAKEYLQHSLKELIEESVDEVSGLLLDYEAEVIELRNFSASNLAGNENYMGIREFPGSDSDGMEHWRAIAKMLLTNDDLWRRSIDKRGGFPTGDGGDVEFVALCKEKKSAIKSLLASFADNEELRNALSYLRLLPDSRYEKEQWQLLVALTQILSSLYQQLLLAFRNSRCIDHMQAGAAASEALGCCDNPSELALALDHKISHILVDEFQDTSGLQLDLLKQLTEGWERGDGRTLFVVGDAMQSCYSFRNANVGIYLDVQQRGLGQIKLQPLTLQSNFRSQANIVDWVNKVFISAFPKKANSSRGAVPYTASIANVAAIDSSKEHAGVSTELIVFEKEFREQAKLVEARRVVETIQSIRQAETRNIQDKEQPESIALLVRSRSHLKELTPVLREAGIQWLSTEIDRLDGLPVIEDLLSLLRAIDNLADRIAWQAILRAPWCGLKLKDLLAIELWQKNNADPQTIYSTLKQFRHIDGLSDDAGQRLESFVTVMEFAIEMRFRVSFSSLLESVWLLLGGEELIEKVQEQQSIDYFFQLLDAHQHGFGLRDIDEFRDKVFSAFVPPTEAGSSESSIGAIQILTMHKAKGLEFDHVIIPGLNGKTQSDNKELINWHERLNNQGEKKLFMGALSRSGQEDDPLYSLIRHEKKLKTSLEDTRLLYIAITRAKKSVALLATIEMNSKNEAVPASNSLLMRIWPEVQRLDNEYVNTIVLSEDSKNSPAPSTSKALSTRSTERPSSNTIRRLREPLSLKESHKQSIRRQLEELDTFTELPSAVAIDPVAACIGTLIHEALHTHIHTPLKQNNFDALRKYWGLQLREVVDEEDKMEESLAALEKGLVNCLDDEENNWIFDKTLEDSSSELEIHHQTPGYLKIFIVDRSFIDSKGTRWIIDYKTAANRAGTDTDSFIKEQYQLHKGQLENYQKIFSAMEDRPIKTALYLSSIPKLLELN